MDRMENAHLVLQSAEAGPTAHHKRVVGGEDSDDVDAFGLEVIIFLHEGWKMVCMAGWL